MAMDDDFRGFMPVSTQPLDAYDDFQPASGVPLEAPVAPPRRAAPVVANSGDAPAPWLKPLRDSGLAVDDTAAPFSSLRLPGLKLDAQGHLSLPAGLAVPQPHPAPPQEVGTLDTLQRVGEAGLRRTAAGVLTTVGALAEAQGQEPSAAMGEGLLYAPPELLNQKGEYGDGDSFMAAADRQRDLAEHADIHPDERAPLVPALVGGLTEVLAAPFAPQQAATDQIRRGANTVHAIKAAAAEVPASVVSMVAPEVGGRFGGKLVDSALKDVGGRVVGSGVPRVLGKLAGGGLSDVVAEPLATVLRNTGLPQDQQQPLRVTPEGIIASTVFGGMARGHDAVKVQARAEDRTGAQTKAESVQEVPGAATPIADARPPAVAAEPDPAIRARRPGGSAPMVADAEPPAAHPAVSDEEHRLGAAAAGVPADTLDRDALAAVTHLVTNDPAAAMRLHARHPEDEAAFVAAVKEQLHGNRQAGETDAVPQGGPGDRGAAQEDGGTSQYAEPGRATGEVGQPLGKAMADEAPVAESPAFSRGGMRDTQGAAAGMRALGEFDEAHQLPRSHATSLEGAARDIDPTIRVQTIGTGRPGVARSYEVTMPDEVNTAKVHETTDGKVFVDASDMSQGAGGRSLYQAVGDYAHNTGKVFAGDPAGLSGIGLRRRTEQMAASALRWGTAEHLEPHPRQLAGDPREGLEPLRWGDDDQRNIENLLHTAYRNVAARVPELAHIHYNFGHRRFEWEPQDESVDRGNGGGGGPAPLSGNSRGVEATGADFDRLAHTAGARAARAGRTTLARAAYYASLVREGRRQGRPGLLAALAQQHGDDGLAPALHEILYSRDGGGVHGTRPPPDSPPNAPFDADTRAPTSGARSFQGADDAGAGVAGKPRPAGGMAPEAVQGLVDRISSQWRNGPKIHVLRSMDEAPEAARAADRQQRSQGAGGQPRGFFHQGEAYLVADALRGPFEVAQTLFHEALGHYGLRGVFGDRLKPVLRQVAAARVKDVAAKMREYGFDPASDEHRLRAAEELLAEMAERYPDLPAGQHSMVRRAVDAVKDALRSMGVPLHMSDEEIARRFLVPAREWVRSGARARVEGASAFSRSGDRPDDPILLRGEPDLWTVPQEVERRTGGRFPSGPVRLLNGVHRGKNHGFGVAHIEVEHGAQIKASGMTVPEYVSRVLRNVSKVWDDGSGRLTLQSERTPRGTAFVQLRREGNYYSVVTAFDGKPRGKLLWSGRTSVASLPGDESPSVTSQKDFEKSTTTTPPSTDGSAQNARGSLPEKVLNPASEGLADQNSSADYTPASPRQQTRLPGPRTLTLRKPPKAGPGDGGEPTAFSRGAEQDQWSGNAGLNSGHAIQGENERAPGIPTTGPLYLGKVVQEARGPEKNIRSGADAFKDHERTVANIERSPVLSRTFDENELAWSGRNGPLVQGVRNPAGEIPATATNRPSTDQPAQNARRDEPAKQMLNPRSDALADQTSGANDTPEAPAGKVPGTDKVAQAANRDGLPIREGDDVGLAAGMSEDGRTSVHDAAMPRWYADARDRRFDLRESRDYHERVEKALLDAGHTYPEAHRAATEVEHARMRQLGFDPNAVEAFQQPYIDHAAHRARAEGSTTPNVTAEPYIDSGELGMRRDAPADPRFVLDRDGKHYDEPVHGKLLDSIETVTGRDGDGGYAVMDPHSGKVLKRGSTFELARMRAERMASNLGRRRLQERLDAEPALSQQQLRERFGSEQAEARLGKEVDTPLESKPPPPGESADVQNNAPPSEGRVVSGGELGKVRNVGAEIAGYRGKKYSVEEIQTQTEFQAVSRNPKPNTLYRYQDFAYETDHFGRSVSISGELRIDPGHRFRGDNKIGYQGKPGDIGFHSGADRFGFQGGPLNVSPGNAKLNSREYRAFENKLAQYQATGDTVWAKFTKIFYEGNTSVRPDEYEVFYRVGNGPVRSRNFRNQPGG